MRDEDFKRKLTEVSEWYIPDDITNTPKGKRRIRKELEKFKLSQETNTPTVNDTNPPKIVSIKTQGLVCEDCEKFCEDGRIVHKKKYTTGQTHWRVRCVTCNRWQNPDTKQFNMTASSSMKFYARFYRKKPM